MPLEQGLKDLIIPLDVQSKPCVAPLSFRAVIHCLAVRGFGGTPCGPRCHFRLENDTVALPVSLFLLAQ